MPRNTSYTTTVNLPPYRVLEISNRTSSELRAIRRENKGSSKVHIRNGRESPRYKLNPFNLQNYDMNYLSLHVDGVQIPSKPLQPNFSKTSPQYVEAYQTLFSDTGIHFLNERNSISRSDYPHGYCLFAFDLTPDLGANCAMYWDLVKHGCVRVEVGFGKAPEATINCIVYVEYDNILEIDSARQVIVDFTA